MVDKRLRQLNDLAYHEVCMAQQAIDYPDIGDLSARWSEVYFTKVGLYDALSDEQLEQKWREVFHVCLE